MERKNSLEEDQVQEQWVVWGMCHGRVAHVPPPVPRNRPRTLIKGLEHDERAAESKFDLGSRNS